MKIFSKIVQDYNAIETATDLKKRGLTPSDLDTIYFILCDLKHGDESYFIQSSIKDYLSRLGAKIEAHGIGYKATI
jgi:hypothetical protein